MELTFKLNNMEQTAVEWLVDELLEKGLIKETVNSGYYLAKCLDEAKEMEKQQIMGAWHGDYKTAEQYYNQTFKSE
jgi:hypothetical protein